MKKQDVTYQDKLNELRLDIKHPNNQGIVFVLLEGQSDIRLFRKLFNLDKCKVETIPGGKFKLEECVGELVSVYPLIIGIRDADFVHLESVPNAIPNIFLTDLHDMEMILLSEDEVFSALMFEFTSLAKENHSNIRQQIMSSIEQVSYFKWLNERENLEFKFEAGFADLISFVNLNIDFEQYFNRTLNKSPNAKINDFNLIVSEIEILKSAEPYALQLCNGHDFMKALSQYIKQLGNGEIINDERLHSSCRLMFSLKHFYKTNLYSDTKAWAVSNNCPIYAE